MAENDQEGENKNMEEAQKCTTPGCPDCDKRALEMREAEETAFAFLLALMPMLTITLFGNMGLF